MTRDRMTRRSFVRGLAVATLGTATFSLLACTATSPAAAPTPSGSTGAATGATQSTMTEEQLAQAARAEGSVVVYTNQDPAVADKTLQLLQDRYKLDVHMERLTSTTANQRFAAETQAGQNVADLLITGGFDFVNSAKSSGWLMEVGQLPSLADWPKQFWDGQVAIAGFLALGIARNTSLVSDADAPQNWEDLLDPKFQDQILLVDPHTAGGPDYWLWLMNEKYGADYLRKLGQQHPRFQASAPATTQALAANAGKVAIPITRTATESLIAQGAPLAHTLPSPTTGGTTLIMISAGAPHPNAAKLLLNFFISRDGQTLLNQNGYSPLPNLPGVLPLPEGYVAADQTKAKAALPELYKLMGMTY